LIIYLDTQDYINLFNEADDGPYHQVLTELMKYRNRGKIVIGFSYITIIEFITKPDEANRDDRVRRGQLIKDICGPNAFPPPSAIIKGAKFPNDGMWMPSAGENFISAQNVRSKLRKVYLEKLKQQEGLNRKQRRQFRRNASMKEMFLRIGATWGRNRPDWGDIPVSEEFIQSRIVERFIAEKCSDREFEKRINAWLMDPAEYSRIFYDYADQPNVIEKFFAKSIDGVEKATTTLQDVVASVQQLNDEIPGIRSNLVKAGMNRSKARKLIKQVPIPEPDFVSFAKGLEHEIGKGRAGHFQHYCECILKKRYNFKRSDLMDLFQMCYAYDCDLFRCDKGMASVFQDFMPFQGKLVERFTALPERIDRLLEQGKTPE